MNDYYKYLPISEGDERWGLSILNTGCTQIQPGNAYPYLSHPAHHNFNWSHGRSLHEYQAIYITRGEGVFESETAGQRTIGEGTIIMLFPGEKHRYKPNRQTGWDEYWVGFNGKIINDLEAKSFFTPENPTLFVGFDDKLLNLFQEIIAKTKEEKAGYQPLVSGALMHTLGTIYATSQEDKFQGFGVPELINKARCLFRSNIERHISPEGVARELQISYSRFRKIFKEYTGIAPGQFQIQLKLNKAKEMLPDPSKSIKEIAYELNFRSNCYFSKLFKEKTGMSPLEFRMHSQQKYDHPEVR